MAFIGALCPAVPDFRTADGRTSLCWLQFSWPRVLRRGLPGTVPRTHCDQATETRRAAALQRHWAELQRGRCLGPCGVEAAEVDHTQMLVEKTEEPRRAHLRAPASGAVALHGYMPTAKTRSGSPHGQRRTTILLTSHEIAEGLRLGTSVCRALHVGLLRASAHRGRDGCAEWTTDSGRALLRSLREVRNTRVRCVSKGPVDSHHICRAPAKMHLSKTTAACARNIWETKSLK